MKYPSNLYEIPIPRFFGLACNPKSSTIVQLRDTTSILKSQ